MNTKFKKFRTIIYFDNYIVRDHLINDIRVLPGVVFIDMIYRYASDQFPDKELVIKNILFKEPVIVTQEFDQEIMVVLENKGIFWKITISSQKINNDKPIDNVWKDNAECELILEEKKENHDYLDIASIKSNAIRVEDMADVYSYARQVGIVHGPFMKALGQVYLHPDWILMALKLGKLAERYVDRLYIQPAFLDAATFSIITSEILENRLSTLQDKPYIPMLIKEVRAGSIKPKECYVYVRTHFESRGEGDILCNDLHAYDNEGRFLFSMEGLTAKHIRTKELITQLASFSEMPKHKIIEVAGSLQQKQDTDILPEVKKNNSENTIVEMAENEIAKLLATQLHQSVTSLSRTIGFYDLGLDSKQLLEVVRELEKRLSCQLYPTLLFEYSTIHDLAVYLATNHREFYEKYTKENELILPTGQAGIIATQREHKILNHVQVKREKKLFSQGIAIIGLAGRYPKAKDIDSFWENLKSGKDCITEIPQNRWQHDLYFDADKEKQGKSYGKWGGFLEEVDQFDPLFFNISPQEAELMDPQERLFIEIVWNTIEDAGYSHEALANQAIGVFVGVMYGQYQLFSEDADSFFSSIANRVSYYFNFHGPSIALDTMCSSSLTGIHLACKSILDGECQLAIAGGVNVTIHQNKYIFLSGSRFLSSDGRCRSFGEGGDGYVPGEGVGAVLLKPLEQALADGDHIYGVIKASSLNHGGKTSGYSVPNPTAQANLIKDTLKAANVNPRAINYIEAHGTGTSLGDPIEIAGLTKAFGKRDTSCAIGSVKSNIGHCESAAGIAAVTKVLLQLQHKTLVPSIHSEILNSNIDWAHTPFKVQRELSEWKQENDHLRIAGISSFGAGGSNAHIIIEEAPKITEKQHTNKPYYLITLSAKTEKSLKEKLNELGKWLKEKSSQIALEDVSYTLNMGRSHFEMRCALVVGSIKELEYLLHKINNGEKYKNMFINTTPQEERKDEAIYKKLLKQIFKEMEQFQTLSSDDYRDNLLSLANFYVDGYNVDWNLLHQGESKQKISLPTYSFDKKHFWVSKTAVTSPVSGLHGVPHLHPFIDENVSTLEGQCFTKLLTGREFYLADHYVQGVAVLPGVVYIEMAKAATELALPNQKIVELRNIIWSSPIRVENQQHVMIYLYPEEVGVVAFEIITKDEMKPREGHTEPIVHAQGKVVYASHMPISASTLEISAIQNRCTKKQIPEKIYSYYRAIGLDYGSSFQVIQNIIGNEEETLAKIKLPTHLASEFTQFGLHPSLLDGALHAIIGLLGVDTSHPSLYLPFSIGELKIFDTLPKECYAYVRKAETLDVGEVTKFNIQIADLVGKKVVEIKEFTVRAISTEPKPEAFRVVDKTKKIDTYYYRPIWEKEILIYSQMPSLTGPMWVVDDSDVIVNKLRERFADEEILYIKGGAEYQEINENTYQVNYCHVKDYINFLKQMKEKNLIPKCILYRISAPEQHDFSDEAVKKGLQNYYGLFHLVQGLMQQKPNEEIKLYCISEKDSVFGKSLSGFLKTVQLEYSKIQGHLIEMFDIQQNSELLLEELNTQASEIRYDEMKNRYIKRYEEVIPKDENQVQDLIKQKGIYLITGGVGGLGLIFARYLAEHYQARLILVGRSKLNSEKKSLLKQLEEQGAEVLYVEGDVSQKQSLEQVIKKIKQRFGTINGVIHSAGVLRDALLLKKTKEQIEEVLSSKIYGTIYLDEVTQEEPLDFFIMFSSIASVFGNIGQCDYAYANGFMDAYAAYREQLCEQGQRQGKTISINWPLWTEGGMHVDEASKTWMEETFGAHSLKTEDGINAFIIGCRQPSLQLIVLAGQKQKLEQKLGLMISEKQSTDLSRIPLSIDKTILIEKVQQKISEILANILKMDIKDLQPKRHMSDYGMDSVKLVKLTNELNNFYNLELTPAHLFEGSTITDTTQRLVEHESEKFALYYQKSMTQAVTFPTPVIQTIAKDRYIKTIEPNNLEIQHETKERIVNKDDIAVIGMSGIFPGSPDLNAFWKNLEQQKDLISEIPKERWDWKAYEPQVKWGGFIEGVNEFDASFFNISPREAELMDPQQRIFLQIVWKTIEDAGYTTEDLSAVKTGLFVGVSSSDYVEILMHINETSAYVSTGNAHSILANRVSYLLNLNGPSIAVDTACSSSLIAIHQAVKAIQDGDCEMAIVGGVNALLTPIFYQSFANAGMLCEDGRCKTFDKAANGYVRGEGAGAILLKPLSKALANHDNIYGVIKGSAFNHGGHVSSLTVPNPNAQAELIAQAIERAKLDIDTITYIETHGTGTSLGDPIEVNGLKKAFQLLKEKQGKKILPISYCGLGAVKTNIGHLEAAAGIAGVIKVLLAMKYRKLPGNVHFKELNPYIEIGNSPFYVLDKTKEWESSGPRRAGISSFGFGGANAHIVLEEAPSMLTQSVIEKPAYNITFSAKTEESLKQRLIDFEAWLAKEEDKEKILLSDVSYTLSVGRNHYDHRCVFIVSSIKELEEKLKQVNLGQVPKHYLQSKAEKTEHEPIFDELLSKILEELMDYQNFNLNIYQKKLLSLADLYVKGYAVDWKVIYEGETKRKVSLPTYPFLKTRYWIPQVELGKISNKLISHIHPLVDKNISSLPDSYCFVKELHIEDFYLADHKIYGVPVLPGVVYLEMAYEVGTLVNPQKKLIELSQVVWIQPIVLNEPTLIIKTHIYPSENWIEFEITSDKVPNESVNVKSNFVLHAKGILNYATDSGEKELPAEQRNLSEIIANCNHEVLKETAYTTLKLQGLDLGPGLRSIQKIWKNSDSTEALVEISIPTHLKENASQWVLHPSILDTTLQTVGVLTVDIVTYPQLPFSVESVKILRHDSMESIKYLHVLKKESDDTFQAELIDKDNNVLVKMEGIKTRAIPENFTTKEKPIEIEKINYITHWDPSPLATENTIEIEGKTVLIVHYQGCELLQTELMRSHKNDRVESILLTDELKHNQDIIYQIVNSIDELDQVYFLNRIPSSLSPELSLVKEDISLFHLFKYLLNKKFLECPINVKVITFNTYKILPEEIGYPYPAWTIGFVYSIAREYPNLDISCLDFDADEAIKDPYLFALNIMGEPPHKKVKGVAIRKNKRYERIIVPLHLPASSKYQFRNKGVYLIVGGSGGIGYVTSEYLAKTYQARLVWIGRGPQSKYQNKIDQIRELHGEVLYYQVDVSDFNGMQRVVQEVKSHFGEIHGAIHSALLLKDVTFANMNEEDFRTVLSPKVMGSVIFYTVLKNESLDFMLFYSSVQSFIANDTQSNYAAASTFQDAFAHYLQSISHFPIKLINWGYWGSVGVVSDQKYRIKMESFGIGSIEPDDGIKSINDILTHSIGDLIVIKAKADVLREIINDAYEIVMVNKSLPSSMSYILTEISNLKKDIPLLPEKIFLEMKMISESLLLYAFQSMGVLKLENEIYKKDLLRKKLNIIPKYFRLYNSLIENLAEANLVKIDHSNILTSRRCAIPIDLQTLQTKKENFINEYPYFKAHINLIWTCLMSYPDLLTGRKTYTEVLFPQGSMSFVEGVYKNNVISDYCNMYVAESIRSFIEKRMQDSPQEEICILEIGAETGGTSAGVIEILKKTKANIRYFYTDTSVSFLKYGEQEWGVDNSWIIFKLLDIERTPESQGYIPGSIDLIFASNVLHATKNIETTLRNTKQLLKNKGVLIINEIIERKYFVTLTFGLTDGWWLFEDEENRISGTPLLSREQWHKALDKTGFKLDEQLVKISGQGVIVCESDGYIINEKKDKLVKPEKLPAITKLESTAKMIESIPSSQPIDEKLFKNKIQDYTKEIISKVLKLEKTSIDINKPFKDYGADSISMLEINKHFSAVFGRLPNSLLFDYISIEQLSGYFIKNYGEIIKKRFSPTISREIVVQPLIISNLTSTNQGGEKNEEPFIETYPDIKTVRVVSDSQSMDIAIIGMSARFPGAENIEEFWNNLVSSQSSISEIPNNRWSIQEFYDTDPNIPNKSISKWGGFLHSANQFDSLFFGISPAEAEQMDPQQRLFLEESWKAIEDSGYSPESVNAKKVGVFVGVGQSDYALKRKMLGEQSTAQSFMGISNSILAARIAYLLDLKGPCLSFDTACSSSLVAIHEACQSLIHGESDMALAGGLCILNTPEFHIVASKLGMLSPEGKSKPFDNKANGFVPAEGVGVIILKPLFKAMEDRDHIYGVIKGTGISQNGRTQGITAPSAKAQTTLEYEVYQRFNIDPKTIEYVEAQGLGSKVADSIEINALTEAFRQYTDIKQYCGIGSIKGNIGHTLTASGMASMVKILLCLKNKKLVPTIGCSEENEDINFKESPFYVNTTLKDWVTDPEKSIRRRAAVNSYGFSGSNAHLILEEAPYQKMIPTIEKDCYLLTLSARTEIALQHKIEDLIIWLDKESKESIFLSNISYTLNKGRSHLAKRCAIVVSNLNELKEKLTELKNGKISMGVYKGEIIKDLEDQTIYEKLLELTSKELQSQGSKDRNNYRKNIEVIANLYVKGYPIDWNILYLDDTSRKIALPTYPFEKKDFWGESYKENREIDQHMKMTESIVQTSSSFDLDQAGLSEQVQRYIIDILNRVLKIESNKLEIDTNFIEFGVDSIIATTIINQLNKDYDIELVLENLFEYGSIKKLSDYLIDNYFLKVEKFHQIITKRKRAEPGKEDINVEKLLLQSPDIPSAESSYDLPLSLFQEQLYSIYLLNPKSDSYNIGIAIQLFGNLDLSILKRAINRVIARQDSLRMGFNIKNDKPAITVYPKLSIDITVIDFKKDTLNQGIKRAYEYMNREKHKIFDLSKPPLLRAYVIQISPTQNVLALIFHHIIADGWSYVVFLSELEECYNAIIENKLLPPTKIDFNYTDYIYWQKENLTEKQQQETLKFWQQQFHQISPSIKLPTDFPRSFLNDHIADFTFTLSNELSNSLKLLATKHNVTLFVLVLSIYHLFLSLYGNKTVVVGVPYWGRDRREFQNTIGLFINTLPQSAYFDQYDSFLDLLNYSRWLVNESRKYQYLFLPDLLNLLKINRQLNVQPLFQVAFNMINFSLPKFNFKLLDTEYFWEESGRPPYDIYLEFRCFLEKFSFVLQYNAAIFKKDTIERMSRSFIHLLYEIVADSTRPLSSYSLLNKEEETQIIMDWNNTFHPYPQGAIHQLVEKQAKLDPYHSAIIFKNHSLNYQDLNQRANQLAHYLIKIGVKKGSLVAICLGKSFEMFIAILAVLKAGGAYLPLDPEYPRDRLQFMIDDSQVKFLISHSSLKKKRDLLVKLVVYLDKMKTELKKEPIDNPSVKVTASDLAYVIYTSGSTGKPKGAMIEHRGLCSLQLLADQLSITKTSRILQVASFSFDASVWDWVLTLTHGAILHLVPSKTKLMGKELINILNRYKITTVTLTPSVLSTLVEAHLPHLATLIVAGEASNESLLKKWYLKTKTFNAYGPTEATICATLTHYNKSSEQVTIGKPIYNVCVYILDVNQNPVPIGVIGEMYIGGVGIARGYLNRPDLIAEKFIRNPFSNDPNDRLYKTGDLARYLPDGNIIYVGRADHQVKIRGFRIELEEIETVLHKLPQIYQAAVIVREKQGIQGIEKSIVAYIIPQEEVIEKNKKHFIAGLREALKNELPDYMIPSSFVLLETLPLTPNGKLDRKALPDPDIQTITKSIVHPRNSREKELLRVWSTVLEREDIDVRDNFFDIGGHSLLAVQVVNMIAEQFKRDIPLSKLFELPTIESFSKWLQQEPSQIPESTNLVIMQPKGKVPPLFLIHPAGGQIFCYRELVNALGTDRLCYGLQQMLSTNAEFDSLESLARQYVDAIQTVQPKGPYYLCGWSIGGILAHEMAYQFEQKGEKTGFLGLIDSYVPEDINKMIPIPAEHDQDFLKIFSIDLGISEGSLEDNSIKKVVDFSEQLEKLLYQAQHLQIIPQKTTLRELAGLFAVWKNNFNAVKQHHCKIIKQPVTLFIANENFWDSIMKSKTDKQKQSKGWEKYSKNKITRYDVPGNHYSILDMPNLVFLIKYLTECLDHKITKNSKEKSI